MTTWNAKGTVLKLGNAASPAVFTAVAQVRTISGPGINRDFIESSHHDSTESWRDFIPGFKDGGEIGLELEFDPKGATHKYASGGLLYDLDSTAVVNWQLVIATSPVTTYSFAGNLSAFEPTFAHEDKIVATASIKISGKPTLA